MNSTSDLTGVVIVDHGSRREESNLWLCEVVRLFEQSSHFSIVEPAHMELADPSIEMAFERCVARGAKRVVVHPYFLLPGRHWDQDIPRLTAAAAKHHPDVTYLVTAPLGIHSSIVDVISDRIRQCIAHAGGQGPDCDACRGSDRCQYR